jgi:hypothetical protein
VLLQCVVDVVFAFYVIQYRCSILDPHSNLLTGSRRLYAWPRGASNSNDIECVLLYQK